MTREEEHQGMLTEITRCVRRIEALDVEFESLREQVVRLSEMWQMANACSNVSELGRGYLLIVREIIEWLDAQGGDTQQVKFVSSAEEMSDSIIAGMPKVRAHRSKKRRFATPESESSTV